MLRASLRIMMEFRDRIWRKTKLFRTMNLEIYKRSRTKMMRMMELKMRLSAVMRKMLAFMESKLMRNRWNLMKIREILSKIESFSRRINICHARQGRTINRSNHRKMREKILLMISLIILGR